MTKLLTAKDVGEIMGVSMDTARNYMRQMVHTEKPLRVTEKALESWINLRMYHGSAEIAQKSRAKALPDRMPRRKLANKRLEA